MKLEDLKQPFSEVLFLDINKQLIDADLTSSQLSVSPENSKFITSTKYYGNYDDLDLHILAVEHSSTEDARVGISLDIFKLMKKYSFQNALVAAYSKNSHSWRYSLVTSNLSVSDAGKITKEFSNPRRYSFVLGPNNKVLTPYKQLIQSGKVLDINELSKRFSLEVVNNEFYKQIARLYDELVGTETITRKLIYPNSGDESHEFVVRLVGRIIFCWFLREKKSIAGVSLVPSSVLSRKASDESNYYHKTLAPLFFEVLNKSVLRRTDKFKTGVYADIPYLNGGLFNDDNIDYYSFDKDLESSVAGLVDVPDSWLRSFFDLLERFNFTVDENTSYDTDLSIDPEMLGRVFENLLARINPETGQTVRRNTGSFYTPREIVEYMVDTSLTEYLVSKTDISREKIETLVSYDLLDDAEDELNKEEYVSVLEALSTLTVLDPACGSGAFPIGMLQKIVFIITKLDPSAKWWLAKQLEGASPELRREFTNRSVDYIRKLGIIRQTIFGVDIQPIATEISRLRCFLTLIVDESIDDTVENRGIRPLPNLDFKFVTANTLILLPEAQEQQATLIEDKEGIEDLKKLRDEYFTANVSEREELQAKFQAVQMKMLRWIIDISKDRDQSRMTSALTDWNPFSHTVNKWFDPEWMFGIDDGFDIVIGNPPYLSTEKIEEPEKSLYKSGFADIHTSRTDIFTYFYKRGLELTTENAGLLCYITSNKWVRAGYGDKIRFLFTQKNPLILIDFGGFKVFESASVDTSVLLIQNSKNTSTLEASHFKNDYKKEQPISEYFNSHKISIKQLSSAPWFIGDSAEIALREKIVSFGTPLKDWDFKITYGIKTGCNEAFIIDNVTRQRLLSEDPRSDEIIKPVLRGRDIKRYGYVYSNLYVLLVGYGDYKTIAVDYPAVYKHLLRYEEKLKNRGQCKVSRSGRQISPDFVGQHHWLELDNNPSREYFNEFEKEKIVWPETMRVHRTGNTDFPRFSLKPEGFFLDKTTFMLDFPYKLFFLGLINSSIGWKLIDSFVDKLDQGGYMMQKATVEKIPIPDPNNLDADILTKIESKVKEILSIGQSDSEHDIHELEDGVDQLVYKLYNLTPDEISAVEESIKLVSSEHA